MIKVAVELLEAKESSHHILDFLERHAILNDGEFIASQDFGDDTVKIFGFETKDLATDFIDQIYGEHDLIAWIIEDDVEIIKEIELNANQER